MSTRKPSPHDRALRPRPEDLESRQLLVHGPQGDRHRRRYVDPQDEGAGGRARRQPAGLRREPIPLGTAAEIDRITVGGTNAELSTLVGRVRKGPDGDGRVFFKRLEAIGQSVAASRRRQWPAGGRHARLLAGKHDAAGDRRRDAAGLHLDPRWRRLPPAGRRRRLQGDDSGRGPPAPRMIPSRSRSASRGWAGLGSSSIRSSPARSRRRRRGASRRRSCNMAWSSTSPGGWISSRPTRSRGIPTTPAGSSPAAGGPWSRRSPTRTRGLPGRSATSASGGCHQLLGHHERQAGQFLHRRRDQERLPPDPDRLA